MHTQEVKINTGVVGHVLKSLGNPTYVEVYKSGSNAADIYTGGRSLILGLSATCYSDTLEKVIRFPEDINFDEIDNLDELLKLRGTKELGLPLRRIFTGCMSAFSPVIGVKIPMDDLQNVVDSVKAIEANRVKFEFEEGSKLIISATSSDNIEFKYDSNSIAIGYPKPSTPFFPNKFAIDFRVISALCDSRLYSDDLVYIDFGVVKNDDSNLYTGVIRNLSSDFMGCVFSLI